MLQKLQGFFDPPTTIHWLLIYMDTSDSIEGGLAWVKGNYSPGARVKGTGDPVVFSLILPVKEKGLIKSREFC